MASGLEARPQHVLNQARLHIRSSRRTSLPAERKTRAHVLSSRRQFQDLFPGRIFEPQSFLRNLYTNIQSNETPETSWNSSNSYQSPKKKMISHISSPFTTHFFHPRCSKLEQDIARLLRCIRLRRANRDLYLSLVFLWFWKTDSKKWDMVFTFKGKDQSVMGSPIASLQKR